MVLSHPRPPLLLPLLLLECAFELPTTQAETRPRASQVPSAPANDTSAVVRHTRPSADSTVGGTSVCFARCSCTCRQPVQQRSTNCLCYEPTGAYAVCCKFSRCSTVEREPVSPAQFPSARVQFRRREHAPRAPFSSAMVRIRRREPALTAPFHSAVA